jgi:GT2 family glycosyltransferase
MGAIRTLSVIAPMRNEAQHVEQFVADLAAQDFDGAVEVIVADGQSTDGSAERLQKAAGRAGVDVRVVSNPAGWVASGLNVCIASAQGDLVVRLDCHSRYPPDYLRASARASEETGAWVVGGQCIAEGRTDMERAVACAMDSPFGGIAWTRALAANRRVEVDALTYGAFRREAFATVGLFDETLVRNQDDEFTLRVRRAGGRVVLDPNIVVRYVPRGSLRAVWRQYYEYGFWKVPVMRKHRRILTARSLAPIAFVGSLVGLSAAAPASRIARAALGVEVLSYAAIALAAAAHAVQGRREEIRLVPRVAATFPAFHLGYGVGMAQGTLAAVMGPCTRVLPRRPATR